MKGLPSWLVGLYPRGWRERYGEEFEATLEQTPARLGNLMDTLKGAVSMQVERMPRAKLILICGGVAAGLAWVATFGIPVRYESPALVRVSEPAREAWLSDAVLAPILRRRSLFPNLSPKDGLGHFRRDFSVRPMGDGRLRVVFSYFDPRTAQVVTQDLLVAGAGQPDFAVLEPASEPAGPVPPPRATFAAVGLVGGLLFGVAGAWAGKRLRG